MPQYQGVWTLPVAARLQSTQQWATDPLFDYTTLLLQADNAANGAQNNTFIDSSSNNFTITRNGNTTQGTFTPFSQSPGWWSNFFNGSGYLTIPDNAAFDIGASEFSIEAFVYPAASVNTTYIFGQVNASSGNGAYVLWVNGSGYLTFYSSTDGTISTRNDIISSTVLPLNIWSHICVCRSGTTLSLYLNGTRVATQTYSATIFNATNTVAIGADAVGAVPFNGYISGLRYLKGSSAYNATSSTLTVPITPLTAITNTQLLTCQSNRFVDNSTNAFTLTVGGTPSVQAFSPFAPQYQWTAPVIGGSGYFDGTGDYLSAAANAAFQFGTGNFTIEYWYYPTAFGTNTPIDMGYANTGSYVIQNASDGKPYFYSGSTGLVFTATTGYLLNAWNHLAVTRSGTTLSMFINGVRVGTATNSTNFNANFALGIGASPTHSTAYEVTGYMSNVRLVKGTAVYDPTLTTLTVPTAPLTAITNTSLLCNFTNAGIVDGTMKNNMETVGNAQVNTSIVKYGTGSMAFDGTGDWCLVPSSQNFNMGTGDWTVECWALASTNTARGVFQITTGYLNSVSTGIGVGISSTAGNPWRVYHGTTAADTTSNATIGVWNHVAFVRFNGAVRLYINGASVYSATDTSNLSTYTFLTVGAWFDSTFPWNGYIDDLRITKGIARYTANFTPPTVALPRQ
jgi:hypothetical protein